MPHTTDRAAFRRCRELLGVPDNYLRRVQRQGRLQLDVGSSGQRAFQALLFDCLFSRGLEHPWDRNGGRTFPDLFLYFCWVAPQPDRLLVNTNTAARVASYLLPYSRTFSDGSFEHSGIVGLRVEKVLPRSFLLRHLPTGGLLELQDSSPRARARVMRLSLEYETGVSREDDVVGTHRAVWREDGLTAEEEAAAGHWSLTPCTELRSALMVRAYLWWRGVKQVAFCVPPRRSNTSRCLRWKSGISCAEAGQLLVDSPARIPGATFTAPMDDMEVGVLRLGTAAFEFDGPRPIVTLPRP